ncbi:MAG: Rrf2 family transcriptional regulator [Synergistaceae bacterium]|jgi:Rrf2 family protein|nr:Rrf2 family transcriptional regulator [Synergistaceae bacterium]
MKLSTNTRYGLRALSALCTRYKESGGEVKPVAVSDIARRQDIPPSYLEQIFAKLRRGKLIESVRGAQGGYVLACPASEITVAKVMRALEERINLGECQTETGCHKAAQCATYSLWRRMKESLDGILETTTLEDIAKGGGGAFLCGPPSEEVPLNECVS